MAERITYNLQTGETKTETYTPEPSPPDPIPLTATPAQGLMALYQLKGITEDDIESAIASISDPGKRYAAQIAYRKTTVWERGSQSMQSIGVLLQLTEKDFDDLFALAPTIKL
ncbi:MAG: hypothetical protein CML17_02215 [Pusillimonas sp.]|jgi:hypothetical protein|nr:hypothetical protein [Pusillimonas sp.]